MGKALSLYLSSSWVPIGTFLIVVSGCILFGSGDFFIFMIGYVIAMAGILSAGIYQFVHKKRLQGIRNILFFISMVIIRVMFIMPAGIME